MSYDAQANSFLDSAKGKTTILSKKIIFPILLAVIQERRISHVLLF